MEGVELLKGRGGGVHALGGGSECRAAAEGASRMEGMALLMSWLTPMLMWALLVGVCVCVCVCVCVDVCVCCVCVHICVCLCVCVLLLLLATYADVC
jgi:hypothetical protein